MIKTLFLKVVNMSITASLAILAVMAVRWLLRKQPKIYSYILWSIVLFRLLCPYSISFDASVFNALPPAQTTNGQIEYYINQPVDFSDTRQEIPGDETVVPDIVIADRLAINTPQQLNIQENIIVKNELNTIDFVNILAVLWIFGTIYILLNNFISLYEIHQILKTSTHLRWNIYSNDIIPTAFITGLINPKIFIPANLDSVQQKYILLHEETHIKRKDYFFKILAFSALSVHWFNPLVWVAYKMAESDMEMSCDEAVIKQLGNMEKAEYSQTLLNISMPKPKQAAMHLAFGEGETKERIINILNYKAPAFKYIAIAVSCIIMCAVLFLTNPVSTAYRQIGIKEKDISTAVFVSGEKYLQLPAVTNSTVTENLKKIKLTATEDETNIEKGPHFIFVSTNENKYYINFNEDFTKIWVLADNYSNSGKVFTVDKPEIFKGIITDNINANWDKNSAVISDTVFWHEADADVISIAYRAANKYLQHLTDETEVLLSEVQGCLAGENATFDYPDYLYSNYDYVAKADYYHWKASDQTDSIILYIKKINDNHYEIIGSYNANDIPNRLPDGYSTKTMEFIKEIPYNSITVKDDNMQLGTSKIVSEGRNGLCIEKVKIHYDEKNNIIKEELLETTVLCESQPHSTHIGTVWNGTVITGGTGKLVWPTAAGRITRGFVGQYPSHNGIDVAAPIGTYIYAADSGVVTKALYTNVGYGIYCIIEHGGYQTLYAHCSELLVSVGQEVQQGQVIARMGATGNATGVNLHFEVKKGDTRYNPYNWF